MEIIPKPVHSLPGADPPPAGNHETLMSLVETVKLHDANPLDLMMNLAVGTDSAKIKTMLFTSNTS